MEVREEIRYMISDASKQVGVEAHVLRYWEGELSIPIRRNEMGHRYYTEDNIERFKHIKEMKEKGFQLKAIRIAIENQMESSQELLAGETFISEQKLELGEKRRIQARELIKELCLQTLQENNERLILGVKEEVGDYLTKQMKNLFREQEERDEERYKRFDELLRKKQKKRLIFRPIVHK